MPVYNPVNNYNHVEDTIQSLLIKKTKCKKMDNIKGEMSDSFTNYNYVGNTKVSVSIKKLMPTNAH